jgi:site-specific DNA recombinase
MNLLPQNPTELLKALMEVQGESIDDEEDRRKYRYVIYCRKSTDQEEKQVRSLADQMAECQELATELGLDVRHIIQESESAKSSETRQKFKDMLAGVKAGKYDGIIAWHPDRLARNMKDAGEIIDLLDKHIIKDLKFKSFSFESNATGKMLLGITFVLSKQYSDQLSDNIARGNRRSIGEGKYVNKTKHGYYKDPNQFLRPDGENFLLIKRAFQMRVENKTLEEVAHFLNKNNYQQAKSDGTHKVFKMGFKKVENFMRDPVYAGVIVYGKKGGGVDLGAVYDFEPAISVPDFMRINRLTITSQIIRLARKYHREEGIRARLMRGMIICAECGEVMTAGITTKKNSKQEIKRYFYYRCDTKSCPCSKKSLRAKVVMDYINNFLDRKPFSSQNAYEHYVVEMKRVSEERARTTKALIVSKKAEKARLEDKLIKMKEVLLSDEDGQIKDSYRKDIKKAEIDLPLLQGHITELEEIVRTVKRSTLTYGEFLELMGKVPEILHKTTQMKELDFIIRKIFLNFIIRGKNVEKSTLNAPFDALYELNLSNGGDGRS